MILTLIDLILIICTGGLWLIVMIARNMSSSHKYNKAAKKYYKRNRYK
jgi:hypothetical protein